MYNHKEIEQRILKFWEQERIYEAAKEKNEKGKKVYFLDGPPYTTGEIHVGTAWNKALKDFYLRTMRMQGYNIWDRAGWDMHGLPITHKVLEQLKLEKQDIEKFGVEKFIKLCEKFAVDNMHVMTEQFKKLGVWMDWENAYKSISPEFIEGVWWVIKRAHENKFLYQGKKTMHWCPSCATSLAKHELEYEEIEDESIFVKLPLEDKNGKQSGEFLLVWTTTPWTMPFNLAVMVNPEIDYVRAEVEAGDESKGQGKGVGGGEKGAGKKEKKEKWIIAKALAGAVIQGVCEKKFRIVEEFKGKKLEGLRYTHPFLQDIAFHAKIKRENAKAHSVILSAEYVDTGSGTGLVHCAPGCGPEDYEIGHRNKLPPYNTLDERGTLEDAGKYTGMRARKDDARFIQALKQKGLLLATTKVQHDYAHCWRCKNAVVFRTTEQWFFDVESKLKEKMLAENAKVKWQPDWAGSRWMRSWLENLRDNGITRQIYWGIPLPVWQCISCGKQEIIDSVKELEKLSGKKAPKDLHRPYIDAIKWKCVQKGCKGEFARLPDVLDVWVDAGSTSFTCLDYPQRTDLFKEYWPADMIMEGKDQIRGWFNLLLVASMVALEKPSFKQVYMHGFINDALGRKMSKSLGNIISPEEVLGKYGADATRLYMIAGTPPGLDLNYDHREAEVKYRNLGIFCNISRYIQDYAKVIGRPSFKAGAQDAKEVEEKYILSRLNSTIKEMRELFADLQFNKVPSLVEELFLELSRFYIQATREKISAGTKQEKQAVLNTISEVYHKSLLMLAPTCPFISEEIYQQLRSAFGDKEKHFAEKSIHLHPFPQADVKAINKKLEAQVEIAKQIIETALSQREEAKLGIRWPLSELQVITKDKDIEAAVKELDAVIKRQVNVKEIKVKFSTSSTSAGEEGKEFRGGRVLLDTELTKELEAEGFTRELIRRAQALRKKAGLEKKDRIALAICGKGLGKILDAGRIKELVNAFSLEIAEEESKYKKLELEEKFVAREKSIRISLKRI